MRVPVELGWRILGVKKTAQSLFNHPRCILPVTWAHCDCRIFWLPGRSGRRYHAGSVLVTVLFFVVDVVDVLWFHAGSVVDAIVSSFFVLAAYMVRLLFDTRYGSVPWRCLQWLKSWLVQMRTD